MGEDNNALYNKVKKILLNKNGDSKKMATIIEGLMDKKVVETNEKKPKRKSSPKKTEVIYKSDPVQEAVDKLSGTPADMKELDEAARQKKYATVVDLLRRRFSKVTE